MENNPDNSPQEKKDNQLALLIKIAQSAYENNHFPEAHKYIILVLNQDPSHLQARLLLAKIFNKQPQLGNPIEVLEKLLTENEFQEDANLLISNIYTQKKLYSKAIEYLTKILKNNPRHSTAHHELGRCYIELKNYNLAGLFFEKAFQLDPHNFMTCFGWAYYNFQVKNYKVAIEYFERCVEIKPKDNKAIAALGSVYSMVKNYEKAILYLNQAIELNPNDPNHYYNLSIVYSSMNKWEMSLIYAKKATEKNPLSPLILYAEGNCLAKTGHYPLAQERLNECLKLDPTNQNAILCLGLIYLAEGNYQEGFKKYEARLGPLVPETELLKKFRWHGEPLDNKTLLISSEQGLGDNIQFIRYVHLIKKLYPTCHIIIEARKELLNIYNESFGNICEIFSESKDLTLNYAITLMSLPLALDTTLHTIPNQCPYIKINSEKENFWKNKITQHTHSKPSLKVGLTWAGNKDNPNDWKRSMTIEDIAPLLLIPNITFFSLQFKDQSLSSIKKSNPPLYSILEKKYNIHNVIDFSQTETSFEDTAAIIKNLDLTISICSLPAHLSGAMNKPTWVLLSAAPDWRWHLHTDQSPWYPSVKLFRQQKLLEWAPVIQNVKLALQNLAQSNSF